MKIQVLFQKPAYRKGLFISEEGYRYSCDDLGMMHASSSDDLHYVNFLESNCPEQVAADIRKDLVKAGLVRKQDFQIVIWQ